MEKFSEENRSDPRFRIGMRNIKTGLAVGLCLIFFQTISLGDGIQAAIAAIICMKSSLQNSIQTGVERMVGTAIGAVLGILALLVIERTDFKVATALAILGVVLIIYLCNILKLQASIVISLVVFLIILIGEKETPPAIYGALRLGETFFGIVVAYLVNRFFDFRYFKQLITTKPRGTAEAIREGNLSDLPEIMAVWLESHLASQAFVHHLYWHKQYDSVRTRIQNDAEVFVYETDGNLQGFIALVDECTILTLGTAKRADAKIVIEKLLHRCQELYPCLRISVFASNEMLVETLVKLGFYIEKEGVNADANADEYELAWSDKSNMMTL